MVWLLKEYFTAAAVLLLRSNLDNVHCEAGVQKWSFYCRTWLRKPYLFDGLLKYTSGGEWSGVMWFDGKVQFIGGRPYKGIEDYEKRWKLTRFFKMFSVAYIEHMNRNKLFYFLAATKQLYEWYFLSVCPSVRLSVCLSVCHTFLTMFPSSYHHEIFRSYHIGPG